MSLLFSCEISLYQTWRSSLWAESRRRESGTCVKKWKMKMNFKTECKWYVFLRLKFCTCWVIVLLKRICSSWFLNWGWFWSECPRRHKRHTLLWCSEKSFFFMIKSNQLVNIFCLCSIIFRPWGQFQPRGGCRCWARKLQSHLPLWDNQDVTRSRLSPSLG